MIVFGHRVIVGWNNEPTLRFGIHREPLFVAIGAWPLLIGVGRRNEAKYQAKFKDLLDRMEEPKEDK